MVFVAGPRQIERRLSRHILEGWKIRRLLELGPSGGWTRIRAARWPGDEALIVLDEIHKWRGWKRWLKGEFDKHRDRLHFLITGSAHLDVYRKGRGS